MGSGEKSQIIKETNWERKDSKFFLESANQNKSGYYEKSSVSSNFGPTLDVLNYFKNMPILVNLCVSCTM
jgi:hypothetical protein